MNSPIVRVTGTFCDSLAHPVVRGRPNCQCLIDKNNGQKVQQIVCPTRRFREPNRRVRLSNVGENTVKGKELARLSKIASASRRVVADCDPNQHNNLSCSAGQSDGIWL